MVLRLFRKAVIGQFLSLFQQHFLRNAVSIFFRLGQDKHPYPLIQVQKKLCRLELLRFCVYGRMN